MFIEVAVVKSDAHLGRFLKSQRPIPKPLDIVILLMFRYGVKCFEVRGKF